MSKNTILNAVSSFIASAADGSVDWDRTLADIKLAVCAELEASKANDAKIESALDSLFDMVPSGTGVPSPAVVQAVASSLAEGNFARQLEWVPQVESYLLRSPRFVSKRGRSGGLFRIG
jgi:hypothetical protein